MLETVGEWAVFSWVLFAYICAYVIIMLTDIDTRFPLFFPIFWLVVIVSVVNFAWKQRKAFVAVMRQRPPKKLSRPSSTGAAGLQGPLNSAQSTLELPSNGPQRMSSGVQPHHSPLLFWCQCWWPANDAATLTSGGDSSNGAVPD